MDVVRYTHSLIPSARKWMWDSAIKETKGEIHVSCVFIVLGNSWFVSHSVRLSWRFSLREKIKRKEMFTCLSVEEFFWLFSSSIRFDIRLLTIEAWNRVVCSCCRYEQTSTELALARPMPCFIIFLPQHHRIFVYLYDN